jgi:hypothetical protein
VTLIIQRPIVCGNKCHTARTTSVTQLSHSSHRPHYKCYTIVTLITPHALQVLHNCHTHHTARTTSVTQLSHSSHRPHYKCYTIVTLVTPLALQVLHNCHTHHTARTTSVTQLSHSSVLHCRFIVLMKALQQQFFSVLYNRTLLPYSASYSYYNIVVHTRYHNRIYAVYQSKWFGISSVP